jgi:hypothetical protein
MPTKIAKSLQAAVLWVLTYLVKELRNMVQVAADFEGCRLH